MLEAYSTNQTVLANGIIPFNSVSLVKGKSAVLNGVSTIELNNCGVYEIAFDIGALPSADGDITINMLKNGVIQPQSLLSIPTSVTTSGVHGTITTLVQVPRNNNACCCSSPTTIQFVNSGVGIIEAQINVVVTKIC